MGEPDADALLDALGRGATREAIDAYCAGGPDALRALLDRLARPAPPRTDDDRPPLDGRAHLEELEEVVGRLATAHPDAFVESVEAAPALRERFEVLAAAGRVRRPETTRWLLDGLKLRRGHLRWLALNGLLARRAPEVRSRLARLLRDRDSLVGFAAADGLRRDGGRGDVDALLAFAESATIGARERALDAVESICDREGIPLPPGHPGPRLVTVRVPAGGGVEIAATTALQRRAGELLARVDGVDVTAPCDAIVVAIDEHDGGWDLVLRRAT